MKYLIELQFDSGLHLGSDVAGYGVENVRGFAHADTLFSAIVNTIAASRHLFDHLNWISTLLDGKEGDVVDLPFKLSSFGFADISAYEHQYYLPKPLCLTFQTDPKPDADEAKRFRRRKFVSLQTFKTWQHNEPLDLASIVDNEPSAFWTEYSKVQHVTDSISLATQIYRTGLAFYHESIRPFFLVDLDEDRLALSGFMQILDLLSFNGLGGRRSSGCGVFEVPADGWFNIGDDDPKEVNQAFNRQKTSGRKLLQEIFNYGGSNHYLFSTYFPDDIESLRPVAYDLVQRKGWFFSTSSGEQLKRKTCFMFGEGSVFASSLRGKLVDVTPEAFTQHRIYRYGLPFTIPFWEV